MTSDRPPNTSPASEPSVRDLKAALRREALERRAALGDAWRAQASDAIRRRLLDLPEMAAARSVALFASFGHEINTFPLLGWLVREKGSVLLPRTLKAERRLELRRVRDLRAGFLTIWQGLREPDPAVHPEVVEPAAADLIVVPGLTFDRRGYRVGYGKGYYDELLARPRACRAVGIVFSPLLRDPSLPTSPWDRPVDAICTDSDFFSCSS